MAEADTSEQEWALYSRLGWLYIISYSCRAELITHLQNISGLSYDRNRKRQHVNDKVQVWTKLDKWCSIDIFAQSQQRLGPYSLIIYVSMIVRHAVWLSDHQSVQFFLSYNVHTRTYHITSISINSAICSRKRTMLIEIKNIICLQK